MIALDKTLKATFDSNGQARINALPDRARDTWKVNRYQTHTNSTTRTTLTVYRGSELGSRIDFTRRGNDDVSENFTPIDVEFGQALIFLWESGSVGAVAEITIFGEIEKR